MRAALKDPELVKRQEALDITVMPEARQSLAEHKRCFDSEVSRWTRAIREAGVQPE